MSRFGRFHRLIIALAVIFVVFVVLVAGLFLGVPPLVRHIAQGSVSQSLQRPVSVGKVTFNPFTLTMDVHDVHIGARDGSGALADIAALHVKLSWSSVRHLAPIIDALQVQAPHLHIVRLAPQRFNISDLIDKALAPTPPNAKHTYFSVSNIELDGGSIDFDDRVVKRDHKVEKLRIGVPFIGNFPSDTDIWVKPVVQAVVDGSPFQLSGQSQVFAPNGSSDLHLKFDKLDLPEYLAYVPTALPVTVRSASVSGDIEVRFEKAAGTPQLHVSGHAGATGLDIAGGDGAPLMQAKALDIQLDDAQPLQGTYSIEQIKAEAPSVFLTRDAHGHWTALETKHPARRPGSPAAEASGPAASHAATASNAAAPGDAQKTPAPASDQSAHPLDLRIAKIVIAHGALSLTDHPGGAAAHFQVADLNASLDGFATLAASAPARLALQATFGKGGDLGAQGTLALGRKKLDLKLKLTKIDLTGFRPYLAQATTASLQQGLLSASLPVAVDWSPATPRVSVGAGTVGVDDAAVATHAGQAPQITLTHGVVDIASIDLTEHRAELKSVSATGLTVHAVRDAHGQIDIGPQAWQAASATHNAPSRSARAAPAPDASGSSGSSDASEAPHAPDAPRRSDVASTASPWRYAIDSFKLAESAVSLDDNSVSRPVQLRLTHLAASVDGYTGDLSKALPLSVSGTLNKDGTFKLDGTLTAAQPAGKLHVRLHGIDITPVASYMHSGYNAELARGTVDLEGDARFAHTGGLWKGGFDGQAGVNNIRLIDTLTKHALAAWRTLQLDNLHARYDGKTPAIHIGTLTLSQFYARAFLDAQGQLNLKHLSTDEASKNASAVPPKAAAPKPAGTGVKPVIAIDQTVLDGGHINFTDNFIQPHYTADILDIAGTIGAFATASTTPTPIKLRGRIAPDGPVSITGTATPLGQPPSLDLSVQARDIALPKFTPYSTKYAGYPIEKGSLTVDLHYALRNGELHANNHLFINQLTFGPRIDEPGATKLPLALAISLLKDSQGRIDVNIPVSGSLSDPDFSVSNLIWHAIGTLVRKVVTAPFAFLGGGKGNSHPDYVVFAPGSAVLSDEAKATLKPTMDAMKSHPQLASKLVGRADPVLDAAALRDNALDRLVKTAKAKDSTSNPTPAEIDKTVVAPADYDKYLEKAYKAADFSKERNWIGMTKTVPPATMKRLLLANRHIGDDDLRALATARAKAVDDYLATQVDAKRLTLAPPKIDTDGVPAEEKTTRVDLVAQAQ